MRINPFRLERYFAEYEFKSPHLLSSSDCESIAIETLLSYQEGAKEQFLSMPMSYTQSPGSPTLRSEVSTLYTTASPEDILVFSGAEEGIYCFMNSLLAPGDNIVVEKPCYQSLEEIAVSIGCSVTGWDLSFDGTGWDISIDALQSSIVPNTKAIVINNSNNPTGHLMDKRTLKAVADIASDNKLWLFSDEVYRFLDHSPSKSIVPAADLYEKAVSLGVMSKSFGLPGLRIGWTATRDIELTKKMAAYKDYTTICCSGPSEFLAEVALRNKQRILDRTIGLTLSNLSKVENFFKRHSDLFEWARPDAGPIAYPMYLGGGTVSEFCKDIAENAGVLLLPGTVYDPAETKRFRIGFGRSGMGPTIEAFENYLSE